MNEKLLYGNLPETPGAYIMKNAAGDVIYVGKAANLKRRVSSYFMRPHDSRIEALVKEIACVDYMQTDTSVEALMLESRLIKRHMPRYNIREKDDKSFLYVVITKEQFPRVLLVRGKNMMGDEKAAFGPFVSASSIRAALKIIRRIFPWSDHGELKMKKSKPCFNYHIGLCPGTCVHAITRADYTKNIRNVLLFFRGEKKKITRSLEIDMRRFSANLEFEKAEAVKRKLFALQHIQDVALIHTDAVIQEKSRIEGYDISNTGGRSAVGGMVVFTNGIPDKAEYRVFNIRSIIGPDDVGMMREMFMRRIENKQWPLPDAMLVDGGLGQVAMAREVLKKYNLKIPVVGIAKGKDRKANRFVGTMPKRATRALLIRVRDEAHRFSRSRHIRLRSRAFLSIL